MQPQQPLIEMIYNRLSCHNKTHPNPTVKPANSSQSGNQTANKFKTTWKGNLPDKIFTEFP